MPGRRALVQLAHELRLHPLELAPQQLAEQLVVAVPAAPPVQRNEEQVGLLDGLQLLRCSADSGHSITEAGAQPLQDRSAQEELAYPCRLLGEDFVQVLAELKLVAGQGRN